MLVIVGDGQRDGRRKADGDLAADGEALVVPRIADVGLENLATGGLYVVTKRAAEVGDEAHPAPDDVAAAAPRSRVDRHVLRPDGQYAVLAHGAARHRAERADLGFHHELGAGAA